MKADLVAFTDCYHPPLKPMPDIPVGNHFGAFGVKRRHNVHRGVDLYAPHGSGVYAIEDGEIKVIRQFTGEAVGSPFWNDTFAIEIEGNTGSFCYGEIEPVNTFHVDDFVRKGTLIGFVNTVLTEDKGKPMSMLHFAIHRHGWYLLHNAGYFDMTIDPTPLLIQLKHKSDLMEIRNDIECLMEGGIADDKIG